MRLSAIFFLSMVVAGNGWAADGSRQLAKVNPLPVALNGDFQFRKTKLYYLSEVVPKARKSLSSSVASSASAPRNAGIAEASMNFERTYRMYGAITAADQRQ